jgi:pilus assembly protein Flp/PilA
VRIGKRHYSLGSVTTDTKLARATRTPAADLERNKRMDSFTIIAPYLRARFGTSEKGAALVEYALLLALIGVVCIVALTTLGGKASSKFNAVGNSLN